ncbi:MAG: hypothetical protein JW801_12555 [Bacteroidales bacterium]|nr:hypothetical protein [Bacteroidales bacterium]
MKKVFFLFMLSGIFMVSLSRDNDTLTDKKGTPVLPQGGDFGFGISANPILSYIGNIFHESGSNSLYLSLPGGSLYGKYFLNAKSALRFKLDLLYTSETISNDVVNDLNNNGTVTDVMKDNDTEITFSLGYEKRKGSNRLQFFYGGELNLGFSKQKTTYSYGNSFSVNNINPTTTLDFQSGANYRTSNRPLENLSSSGIGVGARGFAGIEYFILPKISVGGEFGLGYTHYFGGKEVDAEESWDFLDNEYTSDLTELAKSKTIAASDISSGMLFFMFYF